MALTLIASERGLEIVDTARKKKGWNKTNALNWLDTAGVSRSSLDKFWARKPIKHESFVAICQAVGLDWETVVDNSGVEDGKSTKSLDRFQGLKIAKQIHDWLTALRYEFEAYEVLAANYCEWIVRIPVRRGRFDRVLIRGISSEAKATDLQALQKSSSAWKTDEGWLIVNRRVSPAVREELEQPDNKNLSCMTLDELIDQDVAFEPYLEWLEAEVKRRGIDLKYVALGCIKEEIDPRTQHSIATSHYGEAEDWIEGYIRQWLADDSKEHVSILGEFGTGKTWFAFHYAWECLQAYKKAKEQGVERPRLPLIVTLRDYSKALRVESVLSDLFFNKYDIRLNSSVFDCLNQMGKLLLIFDGFDEMADKVDKQKRDDNFWELAKVVVPGSKVILTSRTEHFPRDKDSREVLEGRLPTSTANLKWEAPRFEVLELEKFNDAQIRQVLKLEAKDKGLDPDIVVEKVMENADLLNLAGRPVMIELIIEVLPDIKNGQPVDLAWIYYYAITRKMGRDIQTERTFTSMADKLYFLCEVAWEMISTGRMTLNYREFPDRIRQIFGASVQEGKDIDHWQYDMMGQTILIRNADGDYMPAHQSFLEFLAAYKFTAELGLLKADFVAAAQEQTSECIDEGQPPKAYTWTEYFQGCVKAKSEGKQIARLKDFKRESKEYLRDNVGREPLTNTTIDLMTLMSGLTADNLRQLIKDHQNSKDRPRIELLTKNEINPVDSNVYTVATSQDGRFLATGHEDGCVRLWDAQTGKHLLHTSEQQKHGGGVYAVAFSHDCKWLVSGSYDKLLKLWDVKTGKCLGTYQEHTSGVNAVAIAPDSTWIVSGSEDNTIKRWNIETGKCAHTYPEHTGAVTAVAIDPHGQWIISASRDNTLKRWNIEGDELLWTTTKNCGGVHAATIAPDGTWIVSGHADGTLRRWNADTGKLLATYTGHSKKTQVNTVAISPDGKWIVSGGEDNTLKRWDVKTCKYLYDYEEHKSGVRAVVISADGRWILSASRDSELGCWEVKTE